MTVRRKIKTKKSLKRKKTAAPITFGLLQHEIDEIIDKANQHQPNIKLEKTIAKELAELLPANEAITKDTINRHHNIIVKNICDKSKHSPYLLDLSEIIQKKKEKIARAEKIRLFLNGRRRQIVNKTISQTKNELQRLKNIAAEQIIEVEEGFEPIFHEEKRFQTKKIHRQFTPKPLIYHFNLPLSVRRSFVVFVIICLIMILPIKTFGSYQEIKKTKQQAVEFANAAYEDLKIATRALADQDANSADKNFNKASNNFLLASEKLESMGLTLKTILKYLPHDSTNLSDAQYLLDAGAQIADIGKQITPALNAFSANNKTKLTDRITLMQNTLDLISPKLNKASTDLNKIRANAIPEGKKQLFSQIKQYVELLHNDLYELSSFAKTASAILGKDYQRRYLFIFQNNNEIRPTGGFMGSFALVDIYKGEIKKMEIPGGGTYDAKGSLLAKKTAPYPLQLINALWQMQDANWFPDFAATAEKIEWFYYKSGGPSVDGVIALNASIVPKLLTITGPITLPQYGKTLNAENFSLEIQKAVEFEYDKLQNKPKQILADLAPELLKKIFATDSKNLMKIILAFKQGLDNKDIQLFFNNAAVQEKIKTYGWTGEIKDTTKDYLMIVNANIGGFKTDNFIKQKVNLVSNIAADGSIINQLTITRKHTAESGDIFGNKSNIDFLRVYTPLGSQLISASGFSDIPRDEFEFVDSSWTPDDFLNKIQGTIMVDPQNGTQINNEFNKTVFGNWVQVNPGAEKTVVLTYKLPFNIAPAKQNWLSIFSRQPAEKFYSLFLQKQSGQQNTHYQISIIPTHKQLANLLYPADAKDQNNQISLDTNLDQDQLIALTIK